MPHGRVFVPILTDAKTVKRAATAADSAASSSGLPFAHCAGLFCLALATSLWFNFATTHIDCASACDGSEYIRDAIGLQALFKLPLSFWFNAFTHSGALTG